MRYPLSWIYFFISHLPCEYFVKILNYYIIQNNRSKMVRNDFMHIMKSPYIISKHVKKHLKNVWYRSNCLKINRECVKTRVLITFIKT